MSLLDWNSEERGDKDVVEKRARGIIVGCLWFWVFKKISLLKMGGKTYKIMGSVFLESIIGITGSCSVSILSVSLAPRLAGIV